MTVYSNDPPAIARDFAQAGATRIHAVDLEGAKDASMPNFDTVLAIKKAADEAVRAKCAAEGRQPEDAFVEIGGGIRLVNPAYETAKELSELLSEKNLLKTDDTPAAHRFFVSDGEEQFRRFADTILPCELEEADVNRMVLS